jgi:hypothetical protein
MNSKLEQDREKFIAHTAESLRMLYRGYKDSEDLRNRHLFEALDAILTKYMLKCDEAEGSNPILISKYFPAVAAKFCVEINSKLYSEFMLKYMGGNPECPKPGSPYDKDISDMLEEMTKVRDRILGLQETDINAAFFDYVAVKIENSRSIISALNLPDGRYRSNIDFSSMSPEDASEFTPEMREEEAERIISEIRGRLLGKKAEQ